MTGLNYILDLPYLHDHEEREEMFHLIRKQGSRIKTPLVLDLNRSFVIACKTIESSHIYIDVYTKGTKYELSLRCRNNIGSVDINELYAITKEMYIYYFVELSLDSLKENIERILQDKI